MALSRTLLVTSVAVTIGGLVLAVAGPATAAGASLAVTYKTTGTTHVAKGDFDVSLGRSKIAAVIQGSGKFKADLPLPTSHVTFDAYGFLPVVADVSFVQVSPATGLLATDASGRSTVTATASYVIQVRNATVGGADAKVGDFCQTVRPVTLGLRTPDDAPTFNVVQGGTITGTYTIGDFKNCGKGQNLIQDLVPGDGNTVSVTLKDGTFT